MADDATPWDLTRALEAVEAVRTAFAEYLNPSNKPDAGQQGRSNIDRTSALEAAVEALAEHVRGMTVDSGLEARLKEWGVVGGPLHHGVNFVVHAAMDRTGYVRGLPRALKSRAKRDLEVAVAAFIDELQDVMRRSRGEGG